MAQTQYSGLKQTDEEYKRKFQNSITPFQKELMKDMNAQLLTMVSIFTALAFLVFGGISSLGSICNIADTLSKTNMEKRGIIERLLGRISGAFLNVC